jgi:hypothetical protein
MRTTRNSGCPICTASCGEKAIRAILVHRGVSYRSEMTFDHCRRFRPLPFDFAVFRDDRLAGLIEFQGAQHYKPHLGWDGIKALKDQKIKDQIKRDYCKAEGIPFLEIPYWELGSLETLLVSFLGPLGLA